MIGVIVIVYPSPWLFGIFTATLWMVVILSSVTAGCIVRNCDNVSDVRSLIASIMWLAVRKSRYPFCKLLNVSVLIIALTMSVFLNTVFVIFAFVKITPVAFVFVKLPPLKSAPVKSVFVMS